MTIDSDLEPLYQRIMEARTAEDLFGQTDSGLPPDILKEKVHEIYNKLRIDVNPDEYLDITNAEYAQEAHSRLQNLYDRAKDKIERGLYGTDFVEQVVVRDLPSFELSDVMHYRGEQISKDRHTSHYDGYYAVGDAYGESMIKIANAISDNIYVENETRILSVLHEKQVPQWKHLPYIIGRFESGGKKAEIFRKVEGVSAKDIRSYALHADGLDQKHIAWIMDRTFSLLGYVHRQGVVHGNICPENILVRPSNHNVFLCNWDNAFHNPKISRDKILRERSQFDPPEIATKKSIGPWTDIYALGKTLIWLVGGDPQTNEVPNKVEPRVRKFLHNMVRESVQARPSDAWDLYGKQCKLKDALWPRRFISLVLE